MIYLAGDTSTHISAGGVWLIIIVAVILIFSGSGGGKR